jgi:hypothetical protein
MRNYKKLNVQYEDLEDLELYPDFYYVFLDTSCFETEDGVFTTKHYPLEDILTFDNLSAEERGWFLDSKIEQHRKVQIDSLHENMAIWKQINPSKRGTVYFSPAATFATIGTEAKPVYVFGLGSLEDDQMLLQSESNYLIV